MVRTSLLTTYTNLYLQRRGRCFAGRAGQLSACKRSSITFIYLASHVIGPLPHLCSTSSTPAPRHSLPLADGAIRRTCQPFSTVRYYSLPLHLSWRADATFAKPLRCGCLLIFFGCDAHLAVAAAANTQLRIGARATRALPPCTVCCLLEPAALVITASISPFP